MQSVADLPSEPMEKQELQQQVHDTVSGMPEHLREILLLSLFPPVPVQADQRDPRYSAGNGEIAAACRRRAFRRSLAVDEQAADIGVAHVGWRDVGPLRGPPGGFGVSRFPGSDMLALELPPFGDQKMLTLRNEDAAALDLLMDRSHTAAGKSLPVYASTVGVSSERVRQAHRSFSACCS